MSSNIAIKLKANRNFRKNYISIYMPKFRYLQEIFSFFLYTPNHSPTHGEPKLSKANVSSVSPTLALARVRLLTVGNGKLRTA
jgi:hypothetical protein